MHEDRESLSSIVLNRARSMILQPILLSLHLVTFMFFILVDSLSSAVVIIPESIVHASRARLGSLLLVGTEFCFSVMANFSSNIHLLLKNDINKIDACIMVKDWRRVVVLTVYATYHP